MADLTASPGDTIEVDFDVSNTGELEGTQDIYLSTDDGTKVNVDSLSGLTLQPSETASRTLTWADAPSGSYSVCVESDDTTDCISIDVQGLQVIDSYESGLSSYSNFGFTTTDSPGFTPPDGSFVLDANAATGGLNSTTGLDNYPVVDRETRVFYRNSGSLTTGPHWVKWAVQSEADAADGYFVRIDPRDAQSDLAIAKRDGGSSTFLKSTDDINWKLNYDYDISITHESDGTITVKVYDYGTNTQNGSTITASDSTFINGGQLDQGFGFRNANNGGFYADYARLVGGSGNESDGGWVTTTASLPTPKEGGDPWVNSSGITIVAGSTSDSQVTTADVSVYDPPADAFSTIADAPNSKRYLNCFWDPSQSRGYAIGGQTSGGSTYREAHYYDSPSNSWVEVASPPAESAPSRTGSFWLNGYFYWFRDGPSGSSWRYDPSSDTYESRAPISENVLMSAGCADGTYGYRLGGFNGGGRSNTVERYLPSSDTWETLSSFPEPRSHASAVYYNGEVYYIGGWDGSSAYSRVDVYDTSTDTWSVGNTLPRPARSPHAKVFGGDLYVAGGWNPQYGDIDEVFKLSL